MRALIGLGIAAIAIGIPACSRSNQTEPSPASSATPNVIYLKYDNVQGESQELKPGQIQGQSNQAPQESISLNYGKIQVPYSVQKDGGATGQKPLATSNAKP